jgi:signal transduction histidine kinase
MVTSGLDLSELLYHLRSQIHPLAEDKKITLEVICDSELPRVRGDRQRLLQALGNLAGNAIKFTPAGGRITFAAVAAGAGVRVSLTDTGPGIAPENLTRVFESFWKTREGNSTGAGLGLSIARGIVEMHGGELGVQSELGKGTVFSMTLPPEMSG